MVSGTQRWLSGMRLIVCGIVELFCVRFVAALFSVGFRGCLQRTTVVTDFGQKLYGRLLICGVDCVLLRSEVAAITV